MENMLNDRIINCYLITKEVVNKYIDLLPIILNNAMEDADVYESFVSDVKNLVFKEYNAYVNLTLNDIDVAIDLFSKEEYDSSIVGYRMKRKLRNWKDIYNDNKIDSTILELNLDNNDIIFNVFSTLIGLIDIKVMKLVKNKLNQLDVNNSKDYNFIKLLHREFNSVFFSQIFDNDFIEIVGLSYNMDIEKIPNIDINVLCDYINRMYSMKDDASFKPVCLTLVEVSKITMNRLFTIEFENDPAIIFKYLFFITRLEELISYIDKNCLYKLLEHCKSYSCKNDFSINKIKKLIKDKME